MLQKKAVYGECSDAWQWRKKVHQLQKKKCDLKRTCSCYGLVDFQKGDFTLKIMQDENLCAAQLVLLWGSICDKKNEKIELQDAASWGTPYHLYIMNGN